MENAPQQQANAPTKRVPGRPFEPGNDPRRQGNGRKPKTDEIRALERQTKQAIQESLEKLIGPALQRLLTIVQKGQDPEAVRIALALLDRTIGSVPSAAYVATANLGQTQASIASAEDIQQLARAYVARLDQRPVEGSDG